QADRLQRDRLAAGVGAGDDHYGEVLPEAKVDRNDVASQKRVAGAMEDDSSFVVHARLHTVGQACVAGFGQLEIEVRKGINSLLDTLGLGTDLPGDLAKDALDLLLILTLQLADPVVQLDDYQRLDEQSGPARRLVVDDPANPAPEIGLDGHHIAVATGGDDRLLARSAEFAHEGAEALLQALVGRAHVTAKPPQAGAGGVQHVALVVDHSLDAPH